MSEADRTEISPYLTKRLRSLAEVEADRRRRMEERTETREPPGTSVDGRDGRHPLRTAPTARAR